MRYFLAISFLICSLFSFGQVLGDLTNDEIIDANDFLLLKKLVTNDSLTDNPADFDGDGKQTVREVVLLHNFLYLNGGQLTDFIPENNDAKAYVQFGQFNEKQNTLEIVLKSKNLSAFEFQIPNINSIELINTPQDIYVANNKVVGLKLKNGFFDEELILKLKLTKGIANEYCISNSIFLDKEAYQFKSIIGDCANPSWSIAGLDKVMLDIKHDKFEVVTDIDLNGKVDIKDYKVLYDYLYNKGETPPGEYFDENQRVKIEVANEILGDNLLEVKIEAEGKVNSFDFRFYGIDSIQSVSSNLKTADFKIEKNRIMLLGDRKETMRQITLTVKHLPFETQHKICIQSPVILDERNHYYQVKLGRCLDVFPIIYGCTDKKAKNYNSEAQLDDGSCEYADNEAELAEAHKKEVKPNAADKIKNYMKKHNQVSKKEKSGEKKESKPEKVKEDKKEKKDLANSSEESNNQKTIGEFESTVKVLSLSQNQLSLLKDVKVGQMIYNTDKLVFMVYDGKKWKKLNVNSKISIQ